METETDIGTTVTAEGEKSLAQTAPTAPPSATVPQCRPPGRVMDYVVVVVFFVAISIPLLSRILGIAPPADTQAEQRVPAKLPSLQLTSESLKAFPNHFDAYINDHFGYRNTLVRWYSMTKVLGLGESPINRVIVGKDGWLFYNGQYGDRSDTIADARGVRPLTAEQVERTARYFIKRRDYFASKGIAYVVLIPPSRESMYREFLPNGLEAVSDVCPLDQLKTRLSDLENFELVDIRQQFLETKKHEINFYKTDTHWNVRGAFLAYQRLMQAVQRQLPNTPGLKPLDEPQVELRRIPSPGMGLSYMLQLPDRLPETEKFELDIPIKRASITQVWPRKLSKSEIQDPTLTKAVVFHDSNGLALMPLISEHFNHVTYLWSVSFDTDLVERVKPAVVIQEMGERAIRMVAEGVIVDQQRAEARALEARAQTERTSVAAMQAEAMMARLVPGQAARTTYQARRGPISGAAPEDPEDVTSTKLAIQFDNSPNPRYQWNAKDEGLSLAYQLENARVTQDGSLTVAAIGGDPQIVLPEFDFGKLPCLVRIDLTTPVDTVVQMFWRTEEEDYTATRSAIQNVRAGRNVLFFELKDPQIHGPLRFDPGTVAGEYHIHSIDVRGP